MRRKLFNSFAAVSLVLFLATLTLWVRSFSVLENVAYARAGGAAVVVRSSRGVIYFDRRSHWDYQLGWSWGRRLMGKGEQPFRWIYQTPSENVTVLGLGTIWGTVRTWPGNRYPNVPTPRNLQDPRWETDQYATICVPCWFAAFCFALSPACWLLSQYPITAAQKRRRGLCGRCSYNLTGNTSGVCPECGTSIPTKLKAIA